MSDLWVVQWRFRLQAAKQHKWCIVFVQHVLTECVCFFFTLLSIHIDRMWCSSMKIPKSTVFFLISNLIMSPCQPFHRFAFFLMEFLYTFLMYIISEDQKDELTTIKFIKFSLGCGAFFALQFSWAVSQYFWCPTGKFRLKSLPLGPINEEFFVFART